MQSVPKKLVALSLVSLLVSSPALAWGGPDRKANLYDAAAMATPEAQRASAKKYWKGSGIKKIQASGYKKVAIIEFAVEYVVMEKKDWSGRGNFGLLDIAQAASGAGKKQMELNEELKMRLPAELYEQMRQRLIEQGFEVKTLEEVSTSPAYAALRGSDEIDTKKSKYGGGYSAGKEKKEIYPVPGLINIKMGSFAAMSNAETQAELATQLGVDVALRAHFRVGVEKGGRPSLEASSWIAVAAGPSAYEAGPGGKTRHSFAQWGQLDAKDGFMHHEDAVDGIERKGTKGKVHDINEEKYEAALKEMFPAFAGMAITLLDGEGA